MHRKQLTIFFIMLALYSLCTFVTYTFFSSQMASAAGGVPMPDMGVPPVILGLANAGIVLSLVTIVAATTILPAGVTDALFSIPVLVFLLYVWFGNQKIELEPVRKLKSEPPSR